MFGPHLMLDCYGCDSARLRDPAFVLKFLDELPGRIGMHKIAPPYLLEYPGTPGGWDRGGISAIVIIAESHISIHTFPHPNGYMNVDIFSCKTFDVNKAVKMITETFGAARSERRLVMRGREFPKEALTAMVATGRQRKDIKLRPRITLRAEPTNLPPLDGRDPTH